MEKNNIHEAMKCSNDFEYFCETYLTLEKGEPFKLLPHQKKIIKSLEENDKLAIMSYRVAGNSTLLSAYITWKINFISNYKVGIIGNSISLLKMGILDRIKRFVTLLPDFLKYQNTNDLEKSAISLFKINDKKSFVKKDFNFLFIDDAAFLENDDLILWEELKQNHKKICMVSAPQDGKNIFTTEYANFLKAESDFNFMILNWYEDPRFNNNLKWIKSNLTLEDTVNRKKYIEMGFKPTNEWFEEKCRILKNNKISITTELETYDFKMNREKKY